MEILKHNDSFKHFGDHTHEFDIRACFHFVKS